MRASHQMVTYGRHGASTVKFGADSCGRSEGVVERGEVARISIIALTDPSGRFTARISTGNYSNGHQKIIRAAVDLTVTPPLVPRALSSRFRFDARNQFMPAVIVF
uniref:Uncharacterized protein n=1 Tax=Plectus sambesii TaxID=2011161 RepID=A0A914W496_9BILA